MNDTPNGPKGKETEELEIIDPYDGEPLDGDGCQTLIVLKETKPIVENKWLRNNIFAQQVL